MIQTTLQIDGRAVMVEIPPCVVHDTGPDAGQVILTVRLQEAVPAPTLRDGFRLELPAQPERLAAQSHRDPDPDLELRFHSEKVRQTGERPASVTLYWREENLGVLACQAPKPAKEAIPDFHRPVLKATPAPEKGGCLSSLLVLAGLLPWNLLR